MDHIHITYISSYYSITKAITEFNIWCLLNSDEYNSQYLSLTVIETLPTTSYAKTGLAWTYSTYP